MRSLSLDTALVALPSLASAAGAAWWSHGLMANTGAGRWFANPLAFLPVQFALGLIATLAAYALYRWFLAYPALSVSNGRTMLIYSAAAAVLFALLHDTGLALALAASFAGAAVALKILRQWPSRDRI